MTDTIRTNWVNWVVGDKCDMCGITGKDVAPHYRKGHTRRKGMILESGLSYCRQCNAKPEAETHWREQWEKKCKQCEDACEKSYQEWGIYCNVSDGFMPSRHFGYVKVNGELKPYRSVHPNFKDYPQVKLEDSVRKVLYEKGDRKTLIHDIINKCDDVPEEAKELIRRKSIEYVEQSDRWRMQSGE